MHPLKILNSCSIFFILGQLTEEASEARNKEFRKFQSQHTRKVTRIASNTDLIHILLVSSDPYISSLRKLWVGSKLTYNKEVQEMFEETDAEQEDAIDKDEEDEDEEDSDDTNDIGTTEDVDEEEQTEEEDGNELEEEST